MLILVYHMLPQVLQGHLVAEHIHSQIECNGILLSLPGFVFCLRAHAAEKG